MLKAGTRVRLDGPQGALRRGIGATVLVVPKGAEGVVQTNPYLLTDEVEVEFDGLGGVTVEVPRPWLTEVLGDG
jgi:hypothetical protein